MVFLYLLYTVDHPPPYSWLTKTHINILIDIYPFIAKNLSSYVSHVNFNVLFLSIFPSFKVNPINRDLQKCSAFLRTQAFPPLQQSPRVLARARNYACT